MRATSENLARLQRLLPVSQGFSAQEYARSTLGVLVGITCAVLLGWLGRGASPELPWLVAPAGATAVLLFAMPSSPLAQPWPVLGGTVISALIGVACSHWIASPLAASITALALALLIMFPLRCLHPPGVSMAILSAFGAPAGLHYSYMFALEPVALNTIALLAAATIYHRICGRRYPNRSSVRASRHGTRDLLPSQRVGVTPEDLDAVLREYNEVFDISRSDLEDILRRTELHAYERRFGNIRCADVMSKDLVKVEATTDLTTARHMLVTHRVRALPVVNHADHVIGIVTQHDFLKPGTPDDAVPLAHRLRGLWRKATGKSVARPHIVGRIMTAQVQTVRDTATIAELVPLFSDLGLHQAPVVDAGGRLVGMLTQTDLISALYGIAFGPPGTVRDAA